MICSAGIINQSTEQIKRSPQIISFSFKTSNVDLMVALEEKLEDHKSQLDWFFGDHKGLYKIPWQSIQFFRYFSLDLSSGLTLPHLEPCH